jgi:hypothetical protein
MNLVSMRHSESVLYKQYTAEAYLLGRLLSVFGLVLVRMPAITLETVQMKSALKARSHVLQKLPTHHFSACL